MNSDKKLYDIVVRIKGKKEGTGFYINKDTIITAYHVVSYEQEENNSVAVICNPDDKIELQGKIVEFDKELDIALIKLDRESNIEILPIVSRSLQPKEEWKSYTCFCPYDDSEYLFEKELIKGEIFQVESFRNRVFDIHLGNDYLSNSIHIGNLEGCSGTPLIINNEIVGIIIKEERSQRDTSLKAASFKKYINFFIKNNVDYKYDKRKEMLLELEIKQVDIENIISSTKMSFENLGVRYNKKFNVDVELTRTLQRYFLTELAIENMKEILGNMAYEIRMLSGVNGENLLEKINDLKNNIIYIDNIDITLLKYEVEKFQEDVEMFINRKYGEFTDKYYKSQEKIHYNNL